MKPAMKRAAPLAVLLSGLLLSGCAITHPPSTVRDDARLTPMTAATNDLRKLPPPKGKVAVAVYGIRDQTGQYKPAPDSSFSTAVTQGASSMLIKALKESGWFIPVERENLQNLLTERKIVRALEMPQPAGTPAVQIPPLLAASVLIEGGITAFETNVRTGGAGARFLGIGVTTQYRPTRSPSACAPSISVAARSCKAYRPPRPSTRTRCIRACSSSSTSRICWNWRAA